MIYFNLRNFVGKIYVHILYFVPSKLKHWVRHRSLRHQKNRYKTHTRSLSAWCSNYGSHLYLVSVEHLSYLIVTQIEVINVTLQFIIIYGYNLILYYKKFNTKTSMLECSLRTHRFFIKC